MDTRNLLTLAGLSLALALGIVGCRSETEVYNTPTPESGTVDDARVDVDGDDARVQVRDEDARVRVRGDAKGDADVEPDDADDLDVDVDSD